MKLYRILIDAHYEPYWMTMPSGRRHNLNGPDRFDVVVAAESPAQARTVALAEIRTYRSAAKRLRVVKDSLVEISLDTPRVLMFEKVTW